MTDFLHAVTGFIAANPHLAYALVLLLAMSESLPLVGAIVPGSGIIVAVSALVPGGTLKLWPLLGAAFLGAIIGDGFAFWLGHHYHRAILTRWPLNRQPGLVAASESFFARHGDKSVFIARFTPGVRAVVPLFAGILGMAVPRFYVANVLSALLWAPAHIVPGVLVGASLGYFGKAAEPLAILAVLLVVIAWLSLQLVRLVIRRGYPLVERALDRLRGWAAAREGRFAEALSALLDPTKPQARGLALLALLLAGAAWLFLGILEDVVSGDPLVNADKAIYLALQDLRSGPGDAVMIAVTELGDTLVVIAVTAAVFLYFLAIRAWKTAGYWLAAVAGASALNTIIKLALHRTRPGELFYTGASAFSFPSGHSTTNMALYGFLAFLAALGVRPRLRPVVAVAAITLVLMIAVSRLYLGAHWFSDVVAGLAFGTLWLAALAISYVRARVPAVKPAPLLVVALVALAAAGSFNIYRHHAFDVQRYAVQLPPGAAMPSAQWLGGGWKDLPARRVDLSGESKEPFTLQWAGSLESLAGMLQKGGWQRAHPLTPATALAYLASPPDVLALPAMPRFSNGQRAALAMVRPSGPSRRLVLRLWPAALDVDATVPVWVGSVVEDEFTHELGLVTLGHSARDVDGPRDVVLRSLPAGTFVQRPVSAPGWDGRVWLGRQAP